MLIPRTVLHLAAAFTVTAVAAMAQEWEIGGAVGYAYLRDASITRGGVTAQGGLAQKPAVSLYASHRERRLLGGDIYYTYRPGALKLTSGGTSANFDSTSHLVHYDLTIHPLRGEGKVQPYFGFGGGIRVVDGTGREAAFQPLSEFAVLSRTREILPLLSLAVGARMQLSKHTAIRFEFRDNISPFPGKVFFVARQASASKWWHDLTPQVGFGVTF